MLVTHLKTLQQAIAINFDTSNVLKQKRFENTIIDERRENIFSRRSLPLVINLLEPNVVNNYFETVSIPLSFET